MRKVLRRIVLVALTALALAPRAGAAQQADAAQRALVERFVAALVNQDGKALRRLYHPASLACINDGTRDFFDYAFAQELKYGPRLSQGYKLTRFGPLEADFVTLRLMGGLFRDPLPPTHQFQIDASNGNRSLTVMRAAVEQNGAWLLVMPCPTEKGLAFFRARRADAPRREARIKELAGQIPPALLLEIKKLLAQDRRIEATKRYQAAAKVDLTTAVQVIDAIAPR